MHPPRHAEFELGDQRAPEQRKPRMKIANTAGPSPVSTNFEVEPADIAAVAQVEDIDEQLAFAAPRTRSNVSPATSG